MVAKIQDKLKSYIIIAAIHKLYASLSFLFCVSQKNIKNKKQ